MELIRRVTNRIRKKKIGKLHSQKFWMEMYQTSLKGMNIGGSSEFEENGE